MFAQRTNWELAANELSALLETLKKNNQEIIDLTESNPTRCGFKYPQKEILKSLAAGKNLLYEPSAKGMLGAREAVGRYYRKKGYAVDAEKILLTASTSEAYSVVFRLLLNPQERVLAPQPSYPLFEFLAQINDIQMDFYPLLYDGGWRVDLEKLKERIRPETRAVILVNPNNPTGSFVKKEELKEINALCRHHKMALICDEVFLDYAYRGRKTEYASCVSNTQAPTFVLSGISKILGLPQMKLGWIVVNGSEIRVQESLNRLEIILDTYLSVNTPSQNALQGWFLLQEPIQGAILKRLEENRKFLTRRLRAAASCEYLAAEGGWYAVLRLPKIRKEEEWTLEFLEKDRVFVHPGYFFDFDREPYIVISLLPPPKSFKNGLDKILKRIKGALS